ncbi:MAG TPA: acyl-CoA dehydrogenase, partial [Spongiibacteraceae bacterium]|nr:acyl-CoA dehydrogenase [Spongiibacteraceae bacterium]
MAFLLALVLWLLLVAAAVYRELPLWLGSVLAAVAWWLLGYMSPALQHPLLWLPLFAVLFILNVPALRRPLFSARVKRQLATLLPPMSVTEREALEAGTAWWDKELFSGKPDWQWFADTALPQLTAREQAFLDNEVETLCDMLDEWQIQHELKDLPPEVWGFLKEKGFFGFIIPPEYGGLGFSPYAQSCVMTKLATRSITAAVSAMVPNSLGPGELLLAYGTDAQKQRWLPGLASGAEIPCFGLTGPEAGSDAGSIPDRGVVCYGQHEGETVLGIRLTFAKRWITLAPVATVVGLAFKLFDPDLLLETTAAGADRTAENAAPASGAATAKDRTEYGITCVLLPANHPGVEIGLRHNPSAPFMNGPVSGTDIFIPIDWIIGGPAMAGKGWRMLMHCLGAGRGISLPAVATAGSKVCYRAVGAFGRIREQFHTSVGRFEGVQEATAEIAASAYTLEALRQWVTRSLSEGSPAVVTAIAKYHSTEMMRHVVERAMDVFGGRGIQLGPRNPIGLVYQGVPLGITVEGANIMTRSLIIFGQGAMRCHPYLFEEFQLLAEPDSSATLARFDTVLFKHIGFTSNRLLRTGVLGWWGRWLDSGPRAAPDFARPWYRHIDRFSAILAITADVGLLVMGGKLKMRELLSARLGDTLSQLFIASSILKYHASLPADAINDLHAEYALQQAFVKAQHALLGFYANFPVRWLGGLLKLLAFPFGVPVAPVADRLVRELGDAIMAPSSVRDALSDCCYRSVDEHDALGRLELTFQLLLEIDAPLQALRKAQRKGEIGGVTFAEQLAEAVDRGIVAAADRHKL